MVKAAHRVWLACGLALFCVPALRAKDLAAYRVGETAEEDIITPVALNVVDPEATATRKAAVALVTPAIFRSYPDLATNAVATEFLAAFAATHSNFLARLEENFSRSVLDDNTLASPDFGKFIAAFNDKSKFFPVPTELAEDWARGGAGLAVQTRLLDSLLQMMHRPIRPDELPKDFVLGETLRLAPVNSPNERVTLDAAEQNGKLITQANITVISRLRMLFRREFPESEQPLARALGAFLKANCVLDANLTQQARDRDVRQLAVVDHYDAGQIIVHRGAAIDAKVKATLNELNEKLMPGLLNQQIAVERDRAQREQEQAQFQRAQAQRERERALKIREQELNLHSQALEARTRLAWLAVALAGVSALTLLVLWRLIRQRRHATLLPVRAADLHPQGQLALQADLAPHLAQAVKETLVQELAVQRIELLKAQQSAAAEIAELVHRLDELQVPLHERLRAYEMQIQKLEKELALRNEENRELLKLKIEMLRRQLETERAGDRMEFN